ncbi:MAG: preprotein translocase subunit YajC [Phycisphaerae bacterium]|nr:preprotein translocase subunit YajC [Phycisphaerae bacterium]
MMAQADEAGGTEAAPAGTEGETQTVDSKGNNEKNPEDNKDKEKPGFPWPLILMMVAIMYFFVFRGPGKQRKEHQKMMDGLKKNDRIRTIGGIMGTVVEVNQELGEVVIKIDESNNTKMRISRQAVSLIIKDEQETKK